MGKIVKKKTKKIIKKTKTSKSKVEHKEEVKLTSEQRRYAQFALQECANWSNRKCIGQQYDCKLLRGEACGYFARAVFPLMQSKDK